LSKYSNKIYSKINEEVDSYFESNPDLDFFPAKKLMPSLIDAGVFDRDRKNGLPLRQKLKTLDENDELSLIPRVYPERFGQDTYWYFLRENAQFVSNHVSVEPNAKEKRAEERADSDENYILELIDELLNQKGSRKHTFEFLQGDLHQNGKTRTKSPIDLFYEELNLALELVEHPEHKKSAIKSKEEKVTVSGVSRAEQRKKYFNRKKSVLEEKGKTFIQIPIKDFQVDSSGQLIRDKVEDTRVLRALLSRFVD